MEKYSIENLNTGTFFVYKMLPKDELDTFSLGMVTNNKIPNFLPLSFTAHADERYFKYSITSKVTLRQFVSNEISCKQCIAMLKGLATVFASCDDYMLNLSTILTDPEHIFVDVSSCQPYVVCLPILKRGSSPDILQFFRGLLMEMRFDEMEGLDYVGKIINSLNKAERFSTTEFCEFLDSMQMETPESENSEYEVPLEEEKVGFLRYIINKVRGGRRSPLPHVKIPSPHSDLLGDSGRITGPVSKNSYDFGETCYLNENESLGEGTTLLKGYEGYNSHLQRAYLVRERTQEEVEINRDVFRLGTERNYVNYIIENNTAISRSHADIIRRAHDYYILDNNSSNHTYVNGSQLKGGSEVPIEDGAEIVLADELFVFTVR